MNGSNNDKTQPTLEVFGESEGWIGKYGHRGICHRHMSNLNIPIITSNLKFPRHLIQIGLCYDISYSHESS